MKRLDDLLRGDAARPLPPGDFTARVMSALPPPRAASPSWLKPVLVMGSAVLGSGIAVVLAPRESGLAMAVADFLTQGVVSQPMLTSLTIGGVLLLSAVVLALDAE